MNSTSDPRRPHKIHRFKAPVADGIPQDPTSDYINAIGMVLSMCGLMLKLKWAAWMAIYCAFITFANTKSTEDTKQTLSGFMLSISAVIMSYMQNIQPMTLPF